MRQRVEGGPSCWPIWTRSSRPPRDWRADYAEPLIAARQRRATPTSSTRPPSNAARPNSTASASFSTRRTPHLMRRSATDGSPISTRCATGATGAGRDRWSRVLRHGDLLLGLADPQRRHPAAGRAGRGVQAHHRGQLRRERSSRAGRRTSAPSPTDVENMRQRIVAELDGSPGRPRPRSTSRPSNCGGPTPNSSSSPTSPRTTCRSRCARSRRSASCCEKRYGDKLDERGVRVHRLRRRRRQAHAGADQRPAHLLPGGRLNTTDADVALDGALDVGAGQPHHARSRSPAPRSSARRAAAEGASAIRRC